MPVPKSKQGKPLGGIGAERMSPRRHALVLDDRLLSKQYIAAKVDSKVDDTAYGASWVDVRDTAPSKGAVQAYLASLTTNASHWSQDGTGNTAKTRTTDTGYVGIGAGAGLEYSAITERLTVDGNIKTTGNITTTGDALIGDDLSLNSDASILNFGADSDVNLTHVADTGLLLNSTRKIQFNDASQYIGASSAADLDIAATTDINLNCTTVDINAATDISGNLAVGGNTTITGNLTVSGTATATYSETVNIQDNMVVLNSNATGNASVDAGIEIERGDDGNRKLFWDESEDKWMIETADNTYSAIAGGGGTITGTNTGDVVINLASGVPAGAVTLSAQTVTFADSFVYNTGTTNKIGVDGGADGKLSLFGTEGGSGTGTTALVVKGGNSESSAPAVSITGTLEADSKSFNIPHPLDPTKRLVYGCLEGPEYGMYARGSFDIEDDRKIVAIDLPEYWSAMVHEDYTINLTTYGNYNVWISDRDENGFWVETNAEKEWSFDWNVMGGRKDAKLVVEPNA